MCDKESIWNLSNCDCECDKSCDVGEYLDYKNSKCKNKLVDKLVEDCIENIDGNKMLHNETLDMIPLNLYKKVYIENLCLPYLHITLFLSVCIYHCHHQQVHYQILYSLNY